MIIRQGIELIKKFEGLHKQLPDGKIAAYLCPANVWTIGWGTTGSWVKPGLVITRAAADLLLDKDVQRFAAGVVRLSPALVMMPERLAAVTSFAYNVGLGAYEASTMRRMIAQRRWDDAAGQFFRWINAGGRPLEGLRRRRAEERALFLSYNNLTTLYNLSLGYGARTNPVVPSGGGLGEGRAGPA